MSSALKKIRDELEKAKKVEAAPVPAPAPAAAPTPAPTPAPAPAPVVPLPMAQKLGSGQRKLIGDVLVELGMVTRENLDRALLRSKSQKIRIGEVLVAEGLITEAQLAEAIAHRYELQALDLTKFTPNPEATKRIPEKTAREFQILPVDLDGDKLVIAVTDPTAITQSDILQKTLKNTFTLKISPLSQILTGLDRAYSDGKTLGDMADQLSRSQASKIEINSTATGTTVGTTGALNVEALVNKILLEAIRDKASDIHIEPAEHIVRIRERIDGVLHETATFTIAMSSPIVSRFKVMANLDIAEKRKAQDGRFQHTVGSTIIDVRISTLPTIRGEKIVLRILDKTNMRIRLDDLGMKDDTLERLKQLLVSPHGLLLVTGPTGSGKTTTVYSMLNHINDLSINIVSVEDPIEYQFDVINQVQVHERAGTNFAGVLRNILRQDPDVIMIGEIRDRDTADIAVRAAVTGHLVISTVHTNDSVSTIPRMVDLGIEPFMLSSSLLGVLAQRLVRVLCQKCKVESTPTDAEMAILRLDEKLFNWNTVVYREAGCEECNHLGYKGRTPIFELLIVDETVQKMIVEGKSQGEILEYCRTHGFESMKLDGLRKVLAGITSVDEVISATF